MRPGLYGSVWLEPGKYEDGTAEEADRAVQLCMKAGFRKIVLRGDTDLSQRCHLDGWNNDPRIRFYFGYDSKQKLEEIADQ
jgi:hypothetical protein